MQCAYIPSHENTDSGGKPRSAHDGRYPGPKLKWPDGRIIQAFKCCSKCLSWREKEQQSKINARAARKRRSVEAGEHYCSRCKEIKPLAEFNVRSIGGPAGWCKVCEKAYQKERAARTKSVKPAFVSFVARQDKGALQSWRTNPDGGMLIAFERGVVEVSPEGVMAWIPRSA